jgi:hypothetical protein
LAAAALRCARLRTSAAWDAGVSGNPGSWHAARQPGNAPDAAARQPCQVTQSNASLVEEAAAAAESLNRQATRLVEAVSLFRLQAA